MSATVARAAMEVVGVTKRYGDVLALDDVRLEVRPGEVYALLGLNGAGKTTLIRVLLGMVRPTSGEVRVLGAPVGPGARRPWADVGHLVESATAYPSLTVRENLDVVRRLHRLPDRRGVGTVIDRLGLGPWADRRAGSLSLGNAQRLGLAKALLHRPSLLVLDEPVNGLDPAGVVEVRDLLVSLARDEGVTVLLSSHLLGEVARTASRLGVLHEGRLLDELRTDELADRVPAHLEVVAADLGRAQDLLATSGVPAQRSGDHLVVTRADLVADPGAVARLLVGGDEPPTRLGVVREDLGGWFLHLVGSGAAAGPRTEAARAR